jgi:mRNA interferase RelE/StbE
MLNYSISKQALRFLKNIPPKHAKQIVEKIEKLAKDPNAVPTEQLEGYPQFHRAKSGEYRMIIRKQNERLILAVVKIGKRNDGDVYKNLDQLSV